MIRKPSLITVMIAVLGIALAAGWDHAMRNDADSLCSNDSTAYDGCNDR